MDDIRSWWEVPSIAHFCSLFRSAFDLTDFDIEDLENGIIASSAIEENFFITDLLCQLLQGCYGRKDIGHENFELYLKDILKHRWELEQQTPSPLASGEFKSLPARSKVEILHAVCDFRLDALDVPDLLKGLDANNMRVDPLGQDGTGATYWYFYGTRLYKEDAIPDPPSPQKTKNSRKQKNKAKAKKHKEKPKRKGRRRGRSWTRRKQTTNTNCDGSNSESDSEEEEKSETAVGTEMSEKPAVGWSLICTTLEDWQALAQTFEKSKIKCEKELHHAIVEDFLPEIPILLEEKEKELRRRLLENAPRRTSSRLVVKQHENKAESESAVSSHKGHDPHERLLLRDIEKQEREEREKMEKEEKERLRAERARRLQLREERAKFIADGKEIPAELLYVESSHKKEDVRCEPADAKTLSGMLKVIKSVRSHKNAWPFCEPVQESFAPSYFDIVKHPMDISTMEKKIRGKDYKNRMEFISDFKLIVKNCHKYNGPESEYSEMVDSVEKWFKKAMKKYVPIKKADNDTEFLGSSQTSVRTARPSRAASSRALEALHQAAAEALQASSRSASSSSDELSGDEISGSSGKPGFIIKMVPFPGSSADGGTGIQYSALNHQNAPGSGYTSEMNPGGAHTHNPGAAEHNYRPGSREPNFSFTAMLQDSAPHEMFPDVNGLPGESNRHGEGSGMGHHQTAPAPHPQQYQMYNQSYAPDSQAQHRQQQPKQQQQQFQAQGHFKGGSGTIDQSALNQLSFSSMNPSYQMNANMQQQQFHPGMANQGAGWEGKQQQAMGNPPGMGSGAAQGAHQPAARLDQSKSVGKPGSGMGHALPQLPAPRTSRVQLRPKAPVATYSSSGTRPGFMGRPGAQELGSRPPSDPFSLLKKNIREMEQKEQVRVDVAANQASQALQDRAYDNISPADSLSGRDSRDSSDTGGTGDSSRLAAELGNKVKQEVGSYPTAAASVYAQQKPESGQGAMVNPNGGNEVPAQPSVNNGDNHTSAQTDSVDSDDNSDDDDSEEDTSESSPTKDAKGRGNIASKDPAAGNMWTGNRVPSGVHQTQPLGNVTVLAGGGFQRKPPVVDPAALQHQQLYGAPGSVPGMVEGGVAPGKQPTDPPPPLTQHSAPPSAHGQKQSGHGHIPQQGISRSASNSPFDLTGRPYDMHVGTANPQHKPQQLGSGDSSPAVNPANPSETLGYPHFPQSTTRPQSDAYDLRSSIMEQSKLLQHENGTSRSSPVPFQHPSAPHVPHPYDPAAMMLNPQVYQSADFLKREQQIHHPLPVRSKASSIPLQSQPLKKRKLYENVEAEVPATPPSKIWRPGVDPTRPPVSSEIPEGLPDGSALPELKQTKLPQQTTNQKSHEVNSTSDNNHKGITSSSVKAPATSSSGRSSRDTTQPSDRSSPHGMMSAQAMNRQALNLSHLKQENGKASHSPRPGEAVSAHKSVSAMTQPSLSTSTHPTFVTVPGLGQPHLLPQGHPGAPHPGAPHPMAMMGFPPGAFPYYHPYMLQQRHAELEMQKQMQENGLLYHQQLMQSSQHGFTGYPPFSPHAVAGAQQKLLVPENSAQQRLLAHLAQTHRANGLLPHQYSGAGGPPHP